MIQAITFLAYHLLSKAEFDRRSRRYNVGFGFRFLGFDWGEPK